MQFELYQQETEKQAKNHLEVLEEINEQIKVNGRLSNIEERAMMHTLQVLIENSIGKARQILKLNKKTVPISAYDLFIDLKKEGCIHAKDLEQWKSIVGLRNSIVHEYMKVDIALLQNIVINKQYMFVYDFLMRTDFWSNETVKESN